MFTGVARVDKVRDQSRALDVLQEPHPEADAFVRTFDQSRHVRDDKRPAGARRHIRIRGDNAKMRLERVKG